jgi:thymidylate synthase
MEEKQVMIESRGIPVLHVEGITIPEAWENSLLELWEKGCNIPTQYDKKGDPLSRDATMMITILEPLTEPRIHRCFPTDLQELEVYRQEVVNGIHDHYIGKGKKGWSYSYHDRLFHYPLGIEGFLNQIDNSLIPQLAETPFSRRCLAITWVPEHDAYDTEPPCLQQVWCRILQLENGDLVLNMNTIWRSRDAFKAAFMNIFALTDLQRYIAERISQAIGREVKVGRYVDFSSSYHIYGSYFDDFQGTLKDFKKRTFRERIYTADFAEPFFKEAREKIEKELKENRLC